MLVARTDPEVPKHKGLTYFLMDMEQEGVQVRPLVQITGEAEFNELFLEEARIPDENIIGGEGNGWAVAITTLMHERATLAFGLQIEVRLALGELIERAGQTRVNGKLASEDAIYRDRLAQLHIESEVLRLNAYRGLTAIMKYGVPGPEGSLGKWHWSEVNQSLTELAMDIAGPRAQLAEDEWTYRFLRARANSIEGGTTEILKNIVAERVLAAQDGAGVNFGFTDDQEAIKRTAREFLAARYKLDEVRRLALEDERGFTDAQWAELAGLGWPGIFVEESFGGQGLGSSSWRFCRRSSATRWRRRRSSRTSARDWCCRKPVTTPSSSAGLHRWRPASAAARSRRSMPTTR